MNTKLLSVKVTGPGKGDKRSNQDSAFVAEVDHEQITVGQRLREIRAQRGLSMRALAEISGLNVNTLSLIENEHTSPSVSTLQQLAQSLQVSMTDFFQTSQEHKRLVHQKQGKRPCVAFEHSRVEDLAAGMARFGAEPLLVTLEPNADSGDHSIVHTGREFVYCLGGKIAYTVNSEKYLLEAGDSLIFEAYLPHHWKNVIAAPSRALMVMCPMDERDRPKELHFTR
jgi:transcriptional regulator with XRE-family HTH domain